MVTVQVQPVNDSSLRGNTVAPAPSNDNWAVARGITRQRRGGSASDAATPRGCVSGVVQSLCGSFRALARLLCLPLTAVLRCCPSRCPAPKGWQDCDTVVKRLLPALCLFLLGVVSTTLGGIWIAQVSPSQDDLATLLSPIELCCPKLAPSGGCAVRIVGLRCVCLGLVHSIHSVCLAMGGRLTTSCCQTATVMR